MLGYRIFDPHIHLRGLFAILVALVVKLSATLVEGILRRLLLFIACDGPVKPAAKA